MKANYNKLWKMLIDKKMNNTTLQEKVGMSSNTLAKMSKDEKDYSAGLTHEIFQLPESRKTAELFLEGKSKAELWINRIERMYSRAMSS